MIRLGHQQRRGQAEIIAIQSINVLHVMRVALWTHAQTNDILISLFSARWLSLLLLRTSFSRLVSRAARKKHRSKIYTNYVTILQTKYILQYNWGGDREGGIVAVCADFTLRCISLSRAPNRRPLTTCSNRNIFLEQEHFSRTRNIFFSVWRFLQIDKKGACHGSLSNSFTRIYLLEVLFNTSHNIWQSNIIVAGLKPRHVCRLSQLVKLGEAIIIMMVRVVHSIAQGNRNDIRSICFRRKCVQLF